MAGETIPLDKPPEFDETPTVAPKGGAVALDKPPEFDPKPAQQYGGVVDEATRAVGTANERYAYPLLGMPGDAAEWITQRLGLPSKETRRKVPMVGAMTAPPTTDEVAKLFRGIGASDPAKRPTTTAGRVATDVGGQTAAALATGGGAGSLLRQIGRGIGSPVTTQIGSMVAQTRPNVAAGVAGGGAGAALAEPFVGTPAESTMRGIGSLAGGMVGGAAAKPRSATSAYPLLEAYERLGLSPTASRAGIGGRVTGSFEENIGPQMLGSGGVFQKAHTKQFEDMADIQQRIAHQFGGPPSTREMAGKTVQGRVLQSWNDAKSKAGSVIESVGQMFNPRQQYVAGETAQALAFPVGAGTSKAVREHVIDPELKKFMETFRNSNWSVTYDDMKALRTHLGYLLEPGPLKTVNDAQLGQIYKAITKDMEAFVKQEHGPQVLAQLKSANADYGKALSDYKNNFKYLIGKEGAQIAPERAYEILLGSASSKGKADLDMFRTVWSALDKPTRGELASTVLARMGNTDASAVGKLDGWSLGKFVSQYKDLSPEAKDLLFRSTGNRALEQSLDDLTRVADKIDQNIKGLRSTSRSYQGGIQAGQVLTGGFSVMGLLATIGGPYAAAKLLTDPRAVKTLARSLESLDGSMEGATRSLGAINSMMRAPGKTEGEPVTGGRF